jgi:ribosomal-protein-alanine N-acetyltransferase
MFTQKQLDQNGEKREVSVYIRCMTCRDIPEIIVIEKRSFEFPWSKEDFFLCLQQQNIYGMVAEYCDKIVGFVIYQLSNEKIHILNFAVVVEMRRQGVGTQIVAKLMRALTRKRNRIIVEVRERNLAAQLFFKSCGFKAVTILRNFYKEAPAEDAYLMEYKYESLFSKIKRACLSFKPQNF